MAYRSSAFMLQKFCDLCAIKACMRDQTAAGPFLIIFTTFPPLKRKRPIQMEPA